VRPLEVQTRLLRALDQRTIRRVGSNETRSVDVRVIAATHRNLETEVREGRFRGDLLHRIAVTRVTIPALRERPEDIPFLVDEILARGGHSPSHMTPETRALLSSYGWPGNVRELRNVVERVSTLGDAGLSSGDTPAREKGAQLSFKEAKDRVVNAFERDYLVDLIERCRGNLSKAAREASIDRAHLRNLLKKHGLREPSE
jgi:two-component system, NtrC family, nitrogen regulation response regulator GlnG